MSLSFRSVVMDIADIKVPFDSLPKTEKIKECYAFFRKYGLLDRQIIVDGDNVLRDGLVGLMVARAVDLKQLKVLQVREKTKAMPATEKTIALPNEAAMADSSRVNTVVTSAKAVDDIKKMREDAKVKQPFSLPSDIACATELDVVCVKTGGDFTRGHVYHYKDVMTYDNYQGLFQGQYVVWALNNPYHAAHVVPLVHRPAKVGEWVRVKNDLTFTTICEAGDILPVIALHMSDPTCVSVQVKECHLSWSYPDRPRPKNTFFLEYDNYDVLEGYDGRYEAQEAADEV